MSKVLLLKDVLVRVSENAKLVLHVDKDKAQELDNAAYGEIISS